MTITKNYIVALLGTMLFANCSSNKTDQKKGDIIDTQTVLSIGKVNISAYEFEKNNKQANIQSDTKSVPGLSIKSPNNWKNNFIDKTYLLADAYDKGYDKNTHIDSIVEGAARFMMSQSNGLLEQELNKDYKVNDDELKEAIDRSTSEFHIEYLKFKDKNSALKNLQGMPVNNSLGFKKLIDKVNLLEVAYKKDVLIWPFQGYWGKEEEIYAMKNNEVSPLLKLHDGYYLIHVENISKTHGPQLTQQQMKLQLEFQHQQKTKALLSAKVYNQARPVVNNAIVFAFINKLNNYVYGPGHTFNKSDFKDLLSKTILTYISPTGQTKVITVNNFIDYYNTLFIKGSLDNIDNISANVNSMFYSDYAYTDAVKLGVNTQPKFLLDRNNFKNNLIYNTYLDQELSDKTAITDGEILNVYNKMKPVLAQPVNVTASIYYFNSMKEAMKKKFNLKSDTLKFLGLIKEDKHIVIDHKSKALPDTLKRTAFDLNNKANPARIVQVNNQYIVVVKESETGNYIRPLEQVKDLVIAEIKNQRLLKNKKEKLAELKRIYRPTIDLTGALNSALAVN